MEDIERTPFGRRLFMARVDTGLSQEDAAKAAGMSQSTLSEAEIFGKRSGFTSQLATLYKVNPNWLATGKGNKEGGQQSIVAPPMQSQLLLNEAIRLLVGMPDYEADAWIAELKGNADIQRAKKRAAEAKARHQEKSARRDDKHGDAPTK